jgi:hypothetical protein
MNGFCHSPPQKVNKKGKINGDAAGEAAKKIFGFLEDRQGVLLEGGGIIPWSG